MVDEFRPQKAIVGFGAQSPSQAALSSWVPPDAIDRFSDSEEVSLVNTTGRADTSGRLTSLIGETPGPRTVLNPGGTITVPFASNRFCLGLIAFHAGATRTSAVIGGDSAWAQVISPDETDVDLIERFVTFYWDKKNGEPELWGPTGISQIVWTFPKAGEVMLQFTPMPLENRFHGLPVTVAGTAVTPVLIRGWLNPTNNALAAAAKDLFIRVDAFSTPNATMEAALGATPAGAGTTFALVTGLDAEGRPKWGEVILDTGVPTPIGTADLKFEAALVDDSDVSVLDESRFNFAEEITPVLPTQPVFTSSASCLTVDGTIVAALEDLTVTMANDLGVVAGGSCRASPTEHKRSGRSTCIVDATTVWVSNRHDVNLQDDSEVVIEIEGRSDVLVDSGGLAGTQHGFLLDFPVAKFADGSAFKILAGATDDQQALSFSCGPTASSPQYEIRIPTDFEDILG